MSFVHTHGRNRYSFTPYWSFSNIWYAIICSTGLKFLQLSEKFLQCAFLALFGICLFVLFRGKRNRCAALFGVSALCYNHLHQPDFQLKHEGNMDINRRMLMQSKNDSIMHASERMQNLRDKKPFRSSELRYRCKVNKQCLWLIYKIVFLIFLVLEHDQRSILILRLVLGTN